MNNDYFVIVDPVHFEPMERINSIMGQQAAIIEKMTPAVRLCERLVNPDDLGYAVEPEVRREAYRVLQGVGLRPPSTNK